MKAISFHPPNGRNGSPPLVSLDPARLRRVIPGKQSRLLEISEKLRTALRGRPFWHLSSTASGGGVAEMLPSLLGYARGLGIDARWEVTWGPPEFFRLTKRLHNMIHGAPGTAPTPGERALYERVAKENARRILQSLPHDSVVVLHDPQTAGLAPALSARGFQVIWRSHIGSDSETPASRAAWHFLLPYLERAGGFVFTCPEYVPRPLRGRRLALIRPSIDPLACKNVSLDRAATTSVLAQAGILAAELRSLAHEPCFSRRNGERFRMHRQARLVRSCPAPAPSVPTVLQVSRWDRLKDHLGVLRSFVRFCSAGADGFRLMLAGPEVTGVADDPEGGEVLAEVIDEWRALPSPLRARVDVVILPMDDLDENGIMVNALQRHATIVVQKSLAEGFGLTVTEALWKRKPVVASAVGGLKLQIKHAENGLLINEPQDATALAEALTALARSPTLRNRLGRAARASVLREGLPTAHLEAYAALLANLPGRGRGEAARNPERGRSAPP